jgi:hypothetical protein
MNTQDRQSLGSEKYENYGCGRSGQPGVTLGSVQAPQPVPWPAIAGLSHVLGGGTLQFRRPPGEMDARRFGTTVVEQLGTGGRGGSHADRIDEA